ncbi:MAG: helicase-related protein [Candidatus Bathyarchaeia archaeon]
MDWPLIHREGVEERLYQERIAEEATKRNTLVVLPTALGKTVIAAYTASHFLYSYRDRKVLMMAPTKPLVNQHRESFAKIIKVRDGDVAVLTGEVPPSSRKKIWRDARLIFSTPQVVRNDLRRGRLTLRDFSLLIFDECHRARKDYAYVEIATRYVYDSPWPVILGTTASPGSTEEKIREICQALYIEHIEYRSEEDLDVAPYINPVEVEWRYTSLPTDYLAISSLIKEMLEGRIRWLLAHRLLNKPSRYVGRRDLLELGDRLRILLQTAEHKGMVYRAIVFQSACLTLYHALDLLETQGLHPLRAFLDKVEEGAHDKKSYGEIVEDERYKTLRNLVWRSSEEHPKMPIMLEEAEKQLEKRGSKILVFTQYRDTATHIVDYLKDQGVSAERFVGQAMKPRDPGLSQEMQAEILKRFRGGEVDVVVATSVAEEGLDIPSVDLVVFYEPVPSAIRHIQRRGRTGRKRAGRAVILAAENTLDEAYIQAARRRMEMMKRITNSLNRQLQAAPRRGIMPRLNPMRPEEIAEKPPAEAEERPLEPVEVEEKPPELISLTEQEQAKQFSREVDKVARRIITPILRRGAEGVPIEDLVEEYLELGYNPAVTQTAITRLEDQGKIYRPSWDRVAPTSAKAAPLGRTRCVEVEKVLPGRAIVWVDDRFRARMGSYDYNGPRQIVKKGSRFEADATLYRDGETLCIRVHRVVKLIN